MWLKNKKEKKLALVPKTRHMMTFRSLTWETSRSLLEVFWGATHSNIQAGLTPSSALRNHSWDGTWDVRDAGDLPHARQGPSPLSSHYSPWGS